jgi:hypothetical protein
MEFAFSVRGVLAGMTVARAADLEFPEFAAFNYGLNYPVMRRWELPFALFQARLSSMMLVLDCTINPVDFFDRLLALYPYFLYRHWNPLPDCMAMVNLQVGSFKRCWRALPCPSHNATSMMRGPRMRWR